MKFYPNIIAPYVNNNKVKFHEDSTENNGFRQPCFDKLKLAGTPSCDSPPPPSRFSPGTAVFIHSTGISSILSGTGSCCNWFAEQIASTVEPQDFANSQSVLPSAFLRISEGRFGSGSVISPSSKAVIIGIPCCENTAVSSDRFMLTCAPSGPNPSFGLSGESTMHT